MMLDIDHFKLVNDTLGHPIGDQVLTMVARVILQSVREVDIVGRIGGEEFAILLPETDFTDAAEVAERIRSAVETISEGDAEESQVSITMSIGVAMSKTATDSFEKLLHSADERLYAAKTRGRNCVEMGVVNNLM